MPVNKNVIQMKEIQTQVLEESSEDEIEFAKNHVKTVDLSCSGNGSDFGSGDIRRIDVRVSLSDVIFNGIVFLVVCINLGVDVTLIFYHYESENNWASALTCLVVCCGGFAVLRSFWRITYDQLDRIYTKGSCVRISVNSLPWLATVITSYQTTTLSFRCRSNPMLINRYVKLMALNNEMLRVQGFAQGAFQAVLQLVLLLEAAQELTAVKATLLLLSISTSLTIMMVSNLPLKNPEDFKSAAYKPKTRLFIGLRMVSSFGSRTISLAVLFSTCKCVVADVTSSTSPVLISHLIPTLILIIPRLFFTLVEYVVTRVRVHRQRSRDSELEAMHPTKTPNLLDILISYVATIFIPFSDPVWVFWYTSCETIAFIVFGIVGEAVVPETRNGCLGIPIGVTVLVLFLILFCIVPCVVPAVNRKVKKRRRQAVQEQFARQT